MPESLLVNYMEFANVGHVIEALRYALAHHAADPSREIGLLLPSNSPWELAPVCPFVHGVLLPSTVSRSTRCSRIRSDSGRTPHTSPRRCLPQTRTARAPAHPACAAPASAT